MNAKEILEDRVARMEIQKTFKERLAKYHSSTSAFCDEIGLANSTMSRLINLTYGAGWDTINRVENGLKKHGL